MLTKVERSGVLLSRIDEENTGVETIRLSVGVSTVLDGNSVEVKGKRTSDVGTTIVSENDGESSRVDSKLLTDETVSMNVVNTFSEEGSNTTDEESGTDVLGDGVKNTESVVSMIALVGDINAEVVGEVNSSLVSTGEKEGIMLVVRTGNEVSVIATTDEASMEVAISEVNGSTVSPEPPEPSSGDWDGVGLKNKVDRLCTKLEATVSLCTIDSDVAIVVVGDISNEDCTGLLASTTALLDSSKEAVEILANVGETLGKGVLLTSCVMRGSDGVGLMTATVDVGTKDVSNGKSSDSELAMVISIVGEIDKATLDSISLVTCTTVTTLDSKDTIADEGKMGVGDTNEEVTCCEEKSVDVVL